MLVEGLQALGTGTQYCVALAVTPQSWSAGDTLRRHYNYCWIPRDRIWVEPQ